MKKIILSIISLMMLSVLVKAQNVNIPDANFKAYLVGNTAINTNGDTEIQISEASAYSGSIHCTNQSIVDVTGIEAFLNVTNFNFSGNDITNIDISNLTNLESLNLDQNQVANIDISNNNLIDFLGLQGNGVASFNMGSITSLEILGLAGSALTSFDVSSQTNLSWFDISSSINLTSLNVANGNNSNIGTMKVSTNSNLTCIQHDAGFDPLTNSNWIKDAGATWSSNCGAPPCTVNIPDANFKAYVVGNSAINTNGNTEIECSEASAFTGSIICNNLNISDLTGIEAFTSISGLNCRNNSLTSLDLSQNVSLLTLDCIFNQIASIDVSQNTLMTDLNCNSNLLTSLDVSQNTALTLLYCNFNNITSLDLSSNTSLTEFWADNNDFTSVNVANGNNGNMTLMDVRTNASLNCIQHDTGFDPITNGGWLKDATASWSDNCSASTCSNIVNISDANFKAALLDHGVGIVGGGISVIDTDGDGEICQNEAQAYTGRINVNGQGISNLTGIEAFSNLSELACGNNQLSSLPLNPTTNLITLYCSLNQFTSLDVSQHTNLTELYCSNNQLTGMDISQNTSLTAFNASSNQLTSLDVSLNTALNVLYGNDNQLTSLNVANGNNTNFIVFNSSNNPNLTCIEVDDVTYSTTNWTNIDTQHTFSTNCNTVLVNSITVQGQGGVSTIATNGGTLQMLATVLPLNANDVSYTWSVANGTGSATINANGLLTATADGTVDVMATANDGSGVSGMKTITISNQSVGIKELAFDQSNVYPNPTSAVVNIDLKDNLSSIRLMDLSGRTVQVYEANLRQLNIAEFTPAIYFLEIANADKKSIVKIIKK